MRSLFLSFLVFVIIFSVFGPKLKYITENTLQDILSLKKDIDSVSKNFEMLNKSTAELQKDVLSQYLAKENLKDIDPEVEAMRKEIAEQQTVIMNPIMQKLMDTGKKEEQEKIFSAPREFLVNITKILEKSNDTILIILFIISIITFLLVFVTVGNELSGFGVLLAKLGFSLSRFIIFIGAVWALFVWIGLKYNVFINISGVFLWGPLSLMIFSAIALKVYDFNSPIWNRMFMATVWPIAAGLIVNTMR